MGYVAPQGLMVILPLMLIAVQLVFSIIALVDIFKNEFEGNNKIIWVIVILVLWLIGAILYFFIGRKQKLTKYN